MTIIKQEHAGSINGVPGRFHNVIAREDGSLANQTWVSETREWREGQHRVAMRVNIRFDDSCRNGRPDFSITANGYERPAHGGRWRESFGGCCHDEIRKRFPELAPLIQWHLCASDGPIHYVANTLYAAGNRDCWGRAEGEPSATQWAVQFGNNPILHIFPRERGFVKWLKEYGPPCKFDFEIIRLDHDKESDRRLFGPKFTFGGYAARWHECPFDSEDEADRFLSALQQCEPRFVEHVTARSEGKARDLDGARHAAIWPDAPESILCAPREELKAALEARLPDLIARFREAVTGAGFLWDASEAESD